MKCTQVEHHRFRFQIATFSATAKLIHAKYGSISHPAGAERRQNAITVARIAHHNRTMSISAAPGLRKPKNRTDHAALRRSWIPNKASGRTAARSPVLRHTCQALMPISRYRKDQTGPNTQLGGVHEGLWRFAYQPGTFGLVNIAPTAAAAKHTPTHKTRAAL